MDPGADNSTPSARPLEAPSSTLAPTNAARASSIAIHLYRLCEELTQFLILTMVVFSPWAFGTTQSWSIWTMNVAGYVLGVALLVKLGIRRLKAYAPPRWESADEPPNGRVSAIKTGRQVTRVLAFTTFLLLAWCLTSALNARATFDNDSLTFEYRESISWLPHSLDRDASWLAFWMYLGLACWFWAVRDWLQGKSDSEEHAGWQRSSGRASGGPLLPARLRRLLWLLAINGALLGVEAIIQRLANSPELLFLVKPRIHQTAEGQFGPYAYRSNAAQYFNLLWPVCLGFWWTLNRGASPGRTSHHVLLVAVAIIAACPIVSTSRAGAIVTLLMAVLGSGFLALTQVLMRDQRRSGHNLTLRALAFCVSAALLLGFALGWKSLAPRLPELNEGLAGRELLYEASRPIARDYPLLGTGPGTFETVSQLYPHPDIPWVAQLHNDWLETRITFGWLGSGLIGLAFVCALIRWFFPGGIHGGRRFVTLTWIALAGCLLHARYDFPFQIHSLLLLFLLLCAILSTLSRRTRWARGKPG